MSDRESALSEYYDMYPPGTAVEVKHWPRIAEWGKARVIARHRQSRGRSVNIEVELESGLRLFYLYGNRKSIRPA